MVHWAWLILAMALGSTIGIGLLVTLQLNEEEHDA